ncbi:MAG: hypothetical protein K6G64_05910 [Eubacterium sp.]|nr:hypothetical protein [Eubacterium sp.]
MKKYNFSKKVTSVALAMALVAGLTSASAVNTVEAVEDEYVYVSMNVPYNDFYESYHLTDAAVWSVEEGVDAVSTATTSKFKGTTGLAKGTYNNDKYIMGVNIPVAVKSEDVEKIKATENNDYAYTVLEQKPEYYSTLTVTEQGSYEFSSMQESSVSKEYLSIKGLTTTGGYGDYQISLGGFRVKDPAGLQVGDEEYVPFTIYGAVLNTADSKSYGMTCLENLWYGTKVPEVEIAWSTVGGQGLRRAHGRGEAYYQFDMNGATLTSVDVITDQGVLTVPCEIKLPDYYTGDTSALSFAITNDSKELSIDGVPADLENVRVSVSGGLANDAEIVNGKVALTKEPSDAVSYTVTISSSNFSNINRTVATPMTDSQIDELIKWIEKGAKALETTENADLAEHVQEAKDMVKEKTASSVEAATLISEVIEKVKNTYGKYEASATLEGAKLSISLGVNLTELVNPTYQVSVQQGRRMTVLGTGALTATEVELSDKAVAGTTYKVTIVSENYQNVTVDVVAAEEVTTPETTSEEVTVPEATSTENNTSQEVTTKKEATTKAVKKTTAPVKVGKASIKKIAKKKKSAKKLSLTLKKVSGVNGYEIRVYASKKNATADKSVLVKKTTSKLSYQLTSAKLKNKKALFVKVRAYKTVKKKNVYGDWSAIKKVKITK